MPQNDVVLPLSKKHIEVIKFKLALQYAADKEYTCLKNVNALVNMKYVFFTVKMINQRIEEAIMQGHDTLCIECGHIHFDGIRKVEWDMVMMLFEEADAFKIRSQEFQITPNLPSRRITIHWEK